MDTIETNTKNKARIARYLNQITAILRDLYDQTKDPARMVGLEALLSETNYLAQYLSIERNDAEDKDHYIGDS